MPITLDTLPIILAHVPTWVWMLFAYLVYQGISAWRDHTVRLARVVIMPVVFIVWGLSSLLLRSGGSMGPDIAWLLLAAVAAPVGVLIGPRRLAVDPARGVVHRRGSPLQLIRNVVLFTLQLSLGIAMAMRPEHREAFGLARSAVSGAMAGYFLGWGLAFWRRYESLRVDAI